MIALDLSVDHLDLKQPNKLVYVPLILLQVSTWRMSSHQPTTSMTVDPNINAAAIAIPLTPAFNRVKMN